MYLIPAVFFGSSLPATPETMATLVDAGTIETGGAPYGAQVLGRLITLVRGDAL